MILPEFQPLQSKFGSHSRFRKRKTMTREEAYARCSSDSYVEFYGGQWLIVPFAPVEQPHFFVCSPRSLRNP
jgi:hypothetical protein